MTFTKLLILIWIIVIVILLVVALSIGCHTNSLQANPKPTIDVNSPAFRAMIRCIIENRNGNNWGVREFQAEKALIEYKEIK